MDVIGGNDALRNQLFGELLPRRRTSPEMVQRMVQLEGQYEGAIPLKSLLLWPDYPMVPNSLWTRIRGQS